MQNHVCTGKLAGWRPRGHHERVREYLYDEFRKHERGDRDLPYRLSAGRKKETQTTLAWNIMNG